MALPQLELWQSHIGGLGCGTLWRRHGTRELNRGTAAADDDGSVTVMCNVAARQTRQHDNRKHKPQGRWLIVARNVKLSPSVCVWTVEYVTVLCDFVDCPVPGFFMQIFCSKWSYSNASSSCLLLEAMPHVALIMASNFVSTTVMTVVIRHYCDVTVTHCDCDCDCDMTVIVTVNVVML
jgi:hypothetical protein